MSIIVKSGQILKTKLVEDRNEIKVTQLKVGDVLFDFEPFNHRQAYYANKDRLGEVLKIEK